LILINCPPASIKEYESMCVTSPGLAAHPRIQLFRQVERSWSRDGITQKCLLVASLLVGMHGPIVVDFRPVSPMQGCVSCKDKAVRDKAIQ
jgi:hypothetical protein